MGAQTLMKKLGGCTTKKDGVERYNDQSSRGRGRDRDGSNEKEISQIGRQIGPDNTSRGDSRA